jgi:hypothetical protein
VEKRGYVSSKALVWTSVFSFRDRRATRTRQSLDASPCSIVKAQVVASHLARPSLSIHLLRTEVSLSGRPLSWLSPASLGFSDNSRESCRQPSIIPIIPAFLNTSSSSLITIPNSSFFFPTDGSCDTRSKRASVDVGLPLFLLSPCFAPFQLLASKPSSSLDRRCHRHC